MIYAVSPLAQKEEVDEFCFKDCGKILIGGLIICDAPFLPCKEKTCPFLEKEKLLEGTIRGEKITVRKLRRLETDGTQKLY